MVTILLLLIFIIYIGLGLPDSALGSAWPALFVELNIPVGQQSFVTFIISFFTALASFFSARFINKLGAGIVVAISTLLSAAALIFFSFSSSIVALCLCAVPLGVGAGAIDAALNNYVAVHYKSTQLNFLHCFYGIGVSLTPLVFSFTLNSSDGWREGYRLIFYIQLAITVVSFLALPLWKKIGNNEKLENKFTPETLSYGKMFRDPAIRASWGAFYFTCALEFVCGYWFTTYFVSTQNSTPAVAARYLTFYYVAIIVGRFVSGILTAKIKNFTVLFWGYALVLIGVILFFLPVTSELKGVAVIFIGLGNGQTFPNLTFITPTFFGKSRSQSIVSSQMFTSNVGIMTMPMLFGLLVNVLSINSFPFFTAILFALMTFFSVLYYFRLKNMKSKIELKSLQ